MILFQSVWCYNSWLNLKVCPVLQIWLKPMSRKQCQELNTFHLKPEWAEVMELALCCNTVSRWHGAAQNCASDSKWFMLASESGLN